jgi:hypothetical protein
MVGQRISKTLEAALDYCARGWSVIPVIRGTKRPAVRWLAYQEHLPSEAEIRDWFERWPDASVAIATGAVSGLVVVDVDPKHGGTTSLAYLEGEHGPLPSTVEAISGGGGRHLYFAHPGGEVRNKVGLAPGIDLRGDGGYIVAPPSLHASGRRYAWRQAHDPGSIALAAVPAWLLRHVASAAQHPGHPLDHWRSLVHAGVGEGERNATIASLTGHLLWHGVDPEVALELLLCWNRVRCRPPLADDEVVHTVLSITRLHRGRDREAPQPDSGR